MFVMAGKNIVRIEDIKHVFYNGDKQSYHINFFDHTLFPMSLTLKEGEELIEKLYLHQYLVNWYMFYPKIETLFLRDKYTFKVIPGKFRDEAY